MSFPSLKQSLIYLMKDHGILLSTTEGKNSVKLLFLLIQHLGEIKPVNAKFAKYKIPVHGLSTSKFLRW